MALLVERYPRAKEGSDNALIHLAVFAGSSRVFQDRSHVPVFVAKLTDWIVHPHSI